MVRFWCRWFGESQYHPNPYTGVPLPVPVLTPYRVYIYYVNTPIRAGIHICVGAGRKGVEQHTSLLYLLTPTNIYKYPYKQKNGPHKGGLFPFYPFWKKNTKWQPSFLKNLFGLWKIYIEKIN
jgi:hypothetical protein